MTEDSAPQRTLRVLLVIDHLGRGGAQVVLRYLAAALQKDFEILVCALRSSEYVVELQGVKAITLPGRKYDLRKIFSLARLLKQEKIDIVHTHLFASSVLGVLAAQFANVSKIICHDHSGRELYYQYALFAWLVARPLQLIQNYLVDIFVCVSREVHDFNLQDLKRPANKLLIAGNWFLKQELVEDRVTPKEQVQALIKIPSEDIIIGSVGRLTSDKGYQTLIRAFALCLDECSTLSLVIVGNGDQRPALEREIQRLNLGSRVHLIGKQNDIKPFLGAFNIYVQPSLYETFGLATIEAMFFNLPVVVSNVGGLLEIVSHRENGLTFKRGEANDLRNQILTLVNDAQYRAHLSKSAHSFIKQQLASENLAAKMYELYTRSSTTS